jgi:CheY-like chemotaxis protein
MGRVLIVDDDTCYLMILGRLCRSAGHEVVTVDNADAARIALAEAAFDLMMFDLQMPRQEGLPLIAEVEQNPRFAPKSIVVTGFTNVAPLFTKLPVIDKGHLEELAAFLGRIPATVKARKSSPRIVVEQ